MIELKYIPKVTKLKAAKSSAKEQELEVTKVVDAEAQNEVAEATEHEKQIETKKDSKSDSNLVDSSTNPRDLKPGDIFYGEVSYMNENGRKARKQGVFQILASTIKGKKGQSREFTVKCYDDTTIKVCSGGIKLIDIKKEAKKKQIEKKASEKFEKENQEQSLDEKKQEIKQRIEQLKKEKEAKEIQFSFNSLAPEDKLKKLIEAGMNNIWMVGPAGCGKSTIARNTAKELDVPYLCISCGIGTSATEFTGYKYPTREATKFAEFYAKKSIILIDEMTALDPSVAQVINAALANGEIETTTGTVLRHPECIIIATSNTFGNGADRQYVANNQLDASTIDRFIGAIIEVNYSLEYESQFDKEVVDYIYLLRDCIKTNSLRRIASTRMIQAAEKMKKIGISDWKDLLITNWTDTEKNIVKDYISNGKDNRTKKLLAA